jgi:hypothetical protein
MGVLLDPETLTAAFASAREAVSAAFDDTAAASACDDLLVSVVVPTIEAAIVGWEISARSGGIEMSAQRALVRRSGIPAEEPSFAARAVAAGETARIAAIGGTHLYLPLAELTAQTMVGVWMQIAPRLHPEWISWPASRPSYADLVPPRTPLERVEAGERLIEVSLRLIQGDHRPEPSLRPLVALMDVAAAVDRRGVGAWPGLIAR